MDFTGNIINTYSAHTYTLAFEYSFIPKVLRINIYPWMNTDYFIILIIKGNQIYILSVATTDQSL